jgi:AraC family transcriptional regulator
MTKTQGTNSEVFGNAGQSYQIAEFTLVEKTYPPNLKIPLHTHDSLVMSFVVGGEMIETNGYSRFECEQSGLVVNPAGMSHSCLYGTSGAKCLVIEVAPQRLASLRQCAINLGEPVYAGGEALSGLARRIWGEYKVMDQISPLAIEGLMLELLAGIARCKTEKCLEPPDWLRQVRDHLHDCFVDALGLQQLAQLAGVHPSHLARLFRRHYGCTVGEYQRRLRLDRATRELAASDKSLSEIALAAGFYDQSHFSHSFKRHVGMTPAAYRKLHYSGDSPPTTL